MRAAVLIALLAATAAASPLPQAAEHSLAQPDVLYVCDAYTAAQCKDVAHCQLCTRADGLELCFSPEIAAQLRSPYVFTCAAPPASAPEEPASDHSSAAAAGVPVDCKALSLEQCKLQQDSCAICISPLQPAGLCYPPATAKDLPGIIFKCAMPGASA